MISSAPSRRAKTTQPPEGGSKETVLRLWSVSHEPAIPEGGHDIERPWPDRDNTKRFSPLRITVMPQIGGELGSLDTGGEKKFNLSLRPQERPRSSLIRAFAAGKQANRTVVGNRRKKPSRGERFSRVKPGRESGRADHRPDYANSAAKAWSLEMSALIVASAQAAQ